MMAAPVDAGTMHLSEAIDLNTSFAARSVNDPNSGVATVNLTNAGQLQESISIGNALEARTAEPFIPCEGCPQAYLVEIDDASSTYGAATGIIVWAGGSAPWWDLSKLPFDQFALVKAGVVSRIEDMTTHKRYGFRDGMLAEVR